MALVIQSLVLLDRSGSPQPERREDGGIYENFCHVDPAGSNSSTWSREEDGGHIHKADLPVLLGGSKRVFRFVLFSWKRPP